MLATDMDGGSVANAGAFFDLRPGFAMKFGRSKHAPLWIHQRIMPIDASTAFISP